MKGVYSQIIAAAEKALIGFEETASLLEYPEIMADRAYYLSLLDKYNSLNFIREKLERFKSALKEEEVLYSLLSETDDADEKNAVYREISALRQEETFACASIAKALGQTAEERAYCRIMLKGKSQVIFEKFTSLLQGSLSLRSVKITDTYRDGNDVIFLSEGEGALSLILPLCGSHKILTAGNRNEWLCVAATVAPDEEEISEDDIKIDVFHSHGAGGQNINKVETAVRATYIPTGLSVVCQDERSQLKNKKRAIENLKRRVLENGGKQEKQRIEEEVAAQFSIKNTPITFDAAEMTVSDARLGFNGKISLSAKAEEFSHYLDAVAVTAK